MNHVNLDFPTMFAQLYQGIDPPFRRRNQHFSEQNINNDSEKLLQKPHQKWKSVAALNIVPRLLGGSKFQMNDKL